MPDHSFDAFELSRLSGGHPLATLLQLLLMKLGLVEAFAIDLRVLRRRAPPAPPKRAKRSAQAEQQAPVCALRLSAQT